MFEVDLEVATTGVTAAPEPFKVDSIRSIRDQFVGFISTSVRTSFVFVSDFLSIVIDPVSPYFC